MDQRVEVGSRVEELPLGGTHAANCLKEGLQQARELAGENGVVLATGSLYFIGALRSALGLKP